MKNKILLGTAVALVAITTAPATFAQDVTTSTKTYVHAQDIEGVNKINFSAFDLNEDGIFSMDEVGERLFYAFDQDGNEVIDNIEWDDKTVMTVIPMEKETFRSVDIHSDGNAEATDYNYETFYKASGLIRFDKNQNGLSPEEFIDVGFQELDDDDDNVITLEEWKEVYVASRLPAVAEQERYN